MIKKIAPATVFAAAMMAGLPAANAAGSPAMCYAQYDAAMATCPYIDEEGAPTTCSQAASIALAQCLQSLATVHE